MTDERTTPLDGAAIDHGRWAALARYNKLENPPQHALDRIASLAARLADTPMAAVSIVDTDQVWCKATYGLAGEMRTPLVPGLDVSAIEQDEPYVVRDALEDSLAARHPWVAGEPAIRSYAAAPITTVDGYRLGTVSVLDTRPHGISDAAVAGLRDLAALAMNELERQLSSQTLVRYERTLRKDTEQLASTLQRTLLPPSLPQVPGMELAHHYHAASPADVTGDFYDVFELGDGRWAFFLGDVSGHGPAAATLTSLARYTLRTAAFHGPDPAAALAELNSVLLMDSHTRRHCTVLFGVLRPHRDGGFNITLAGGGHPPALLLDPPHRVEEVWPVGGMLVGALPDAVFATREIHLTAGQTLLLYTDGLTEARVDDELFGEQRLLAFLADHAGEGARKVVAGVRRLIEGFTSPPTDDVALLALSAGGASRGPG